MIFVLSDLHLSDGTTSTNINPDAFSIMESEVLDTYKNRKAASLKIILLGDIFDLVRTDYWLKKPIAERPWNGSLDKLTAMNPDPKIEKYYGEVLTQVLADKSSKQFIKSLKDISAKIPNTEIVYVIGNHDRMFNNYPLLKDKASKETGLKFTFVNSFSDASYSLVARHGHEFDVNCHGYEFYKKVLNPGANVNRFSPECYAVQCIGEVITAEMMSGIIYRLRQKNASADLVTKALDLNNVRPMMDVLLWLEWISRSMDNANEKAILMDAFRESVDALLATDLAKQWDDLVREFWIFTGDITDRLEQVRKYIQGKSFDDIKDTVETFKFFEGMFGHGKDDNVEGAKSEWKDATVPASIQYILYGHTHVARHDIFSARSDGSVNMYVNTGTYLPLIEKAEESGFATSKQMSLTYFFNSKEDCPGDNKKADTVSMEIWNGTRMKLYK
jgi:UDP-2,3-diacylglucosamine pyrophosphatase LpxH